MTIRARAALVDCEHALTDYEAGANTVFQYPRWVALITLLRIVGTVLDKVDRPAASAEVQERIRDAWNRLKTSRPEPRIFHQFINEDRNLTLKAYEVRPSVNITIRLGGVWTNLKTGNSGNDPCGPTTFEFIMREGPFKGRDTRDLCREAIAFWRMYLDAIDATSM
jgi:hypothetical protein